MEGALIGLVMLVSAAGGPQPPVPQRDPAAFREMIERPLVAPGSASARKAAAPSQAPRRRMSEDQRVAIILAGIVAGAYGGAAAGHMMTSGCSCDSPGYGAIIGVPIGATLGAIVGWHLSR